MPLCCLLWRSGQSYNLPKLVAYIKILSGLNTLIQSDKRFVFKGDKINYMALMLFGLTGDRGLK
jgi:hypothetical protein